MNILKMPLGEILVFVLIVGLLGYVMWRLVQGIKDTDSHGTSFIGIAIRTGLVVSGITHAVLAVWSIKLLLKGSDPSQPESALNSFLQTDTGAWVFGSVGVVFIGVGIAHIVKGVTARFERYMSIPEMHEKWVSPLCQFGLISRGFVWCVLGWVVIRSSMTLGDPRDKSTTHALQVISDHAYGDWFLGVVAIGLLAFGIYSVLESFYRRIG